MALLKCDRWREVAEKCDRYTRAVGWPRTRGQEVITTGDCSLRADIPDTDTEVVIKLEIPKVRKKVERTNRVY